MQIHRILVVVYYVAQVVVEVQDYALDDCFQTERHTFLSYSGVLKKKEDYLHAGPGDGYPGPCSLLLVNQRCMVNSARFGNTAITGLIEKASDSIAGENRQQEQAALYHL